MNAQHFSEIHGDRGRCPTRPSRPTRLARSITDADDGLYRYVPVPPVYHDEDGYPVEDDMPQTQDHQRQTAHWCEALQWYFPAATVCSNLAMPYEQGDCDKVLVPDLFVALRAPRLGDRQSYKLWENPVPDVVIEMLSPDRSWKDDMGSKRRTCEMLGIREYWLFEPPGRRLSAPLEGYRLHGRRYRRIGADAAGRFPSEVLGLDLHLCDARLRLRDPAKGENLPTYDEIVTLREEAEARRDAAIARRKAAEAAADQAAAERRAADARDARKAVERELERLRLRIAELE